MKKQIWKRPPSYHGYHSNKRVLAVFAVMAQGLAATSDDRAIAERLTDLKHRLEYRIGDKGHADVQFFVNTVFDDFLDVREAMDGRERSELEAALHLFETDVKKLTDLIREEVSVTPWDDETDHRVAKLIENTASIRTIFKRIVDDLRRMRKKRDKASSELLTAVQYGTDRERLALRERRLNTYCASREKAVKSLEDILDELDEIATLARNTPTLAGRANRRIKIKRLADFYVHPLKAQAQREKLKGELLFIIKSVDATDGATNDWGAVLYGEDGRTAEASQPAVRERGSESSRAEGTYAEKSSRRTTTAQTDLIESGANKNTAREGE